MKTSMRTVCLPRKNTYHLSDCLSHSDRSYGIYEQSHNCCQQSAVHLQMMQRQL